MNVNLTPYTGKKICVALSGGRDSMALLHYLKANAKQFLIELSALNCDHSMRGEESVRDSDFVKDYCAQNDIPLTFFKAEAGQLNGENDARVWRMQCYKAVLECGADYVATAHHMNDNAETLLFNLARGCSLSGMTGIVDRRASGLIRPLIACTREEIDAYVEQNAIPYVTDSTNLTADYTRNKIRQNVLPALEEAVPGAVNSIYRFSRLAAEDEEYFSRQVDKVLVCRDDGNYLVKSCTEPVIFKRVITRILKSNNLKDFTAAQLRTVYEMQWLNNGKKFNFLGLTAIKEEGGIAIVKKTQTAFEAPFELGNFGNYTIDESGECGCGEKLLKFDMDKIPCGAVVRNRREGDRFCKFGGGTKSLSDFLTDKKIPQSMRDSLPLVCLGGEVLIVGGVEISDKVKLTEGTVRGGVFICRNPLE